LFYSSRTLQAVAQGEQLASVQTPPLWRPNVFDRWKMTLNCLQRTEPDFALELINSARTKETAVVISAMHGRRNTDLSDIKSTIDSLRKAFDPNIPAMFGD
jgi:hypothetical protein